MSHELVDVLVIPVIRYLAVQGVLPHELASANLEDETDIGTLGLDSLAKLHLLSELEARTNVVVTESTLVDLRTLGDLARTVRRS